MSSVKFTLKREIRNEITKFIDDEFKKETKIEIVKYINEIHKVSIDDYYYDENDINSRVSLIDRGKFDINEYIFADDFLSQPSWEGTYLEYEKDDKNDGEHTTTYKYEPLDILHVIYEKVSDTMNLKKEEIYKSFKKKYFNEDILLESIKCFKRTRDGKEYYDLVIEDINPDKKRSLIEKIKIEMQNAFKSRYGSSVDSKVHAICSELLFDVYDEGCTLLNINNDFKCEVITEDEYTESADGIFNIISKNIKNINYTSHGVKLLKFNTVVSIDKKINKLLEMKIYATDEHMNLFLEEARKFVLEYYRSFKLKGIQRELESKEDKILLIIKRISLIEDLLYKEYLKENPKAPSLEDIKDFKECINWIILRGVIWASENIYIKKKAKDEIMDIINDSPIDEYPEARFMKRHFYLHVGETNTGKTYSSIQRLMEVQTGVYLAPLRLLALEIQDKLNSNNISCSLLTGEEEDIVAYSGHISSTIEKLQIENEYDVCVIDEAQMISDKQRGWAWTRAIIGVLSPEIHICMAPEALDIIIKLIKDCNDTYEVINHTRDTELIFEDKVFDLNKDVKKGDALVVFGKRKALAVCAELLNKNIKASVIYGSLPYSTRRKQFDRFLKGDTDVIVCTDAIGMGVNLPIKRIVFLETRKFDGISLRRLNVSEIKQIGGRAGRKNIYDVGYVTAATDINLIKSALKNKSNKIEKCFIGIPDSLLEIDIDIIDALKTWSTTNNNGYFEKTDVTRITYLLNRLNKFNLNVSKKDALKMATIPFEENNKEVYALWEEYCKMYSKGAINLKKPQLKKNTSSKKELDNLESYYKCLDLNYSFSKNFNIKINNRFINSEKENSANKINNLLLTSLLDHERVCSVCGKKLSWDYPNDICRRCRDIIHENKRDKHIPVFKKKKRFEYRFRRKNTRRR